VCTYRILKKGNTMEGKGKKNRFSEQPLCKFGPGGDFVHELSAKKALSSAPIHDNPLGKVLELLGKLGAHRTRAAGSVPAGKGI
jgi:hypothetical protein